MKIIKKPSFRKKFLPLPHIKTHQMSATKKTSKWIVTAVCLAVMAAGAWYFVQLTGGYDGDEASWVYIPQGATTDEARDSIKSALGNNFGSRVAMLWGGDAAAARGAYRIEPGDKAWRVARRFDQGNQTPVKVTFNNIRTLDNLADRISSRMDFTAADFRNALTQAAQTESLSIEEIEAQMLPDTYETYWTATPADLIKKIRANASRFWTEERVAKARALGLTPLQASTLASIVEEESTVRAERPDIARLYLNRLHKGMKLQADPTVKFATGDFAARRITADMLKVQSPYNTYVVAGLPPGIIRFPEARTIDQVLDAPEHSYIYMCARPDGSGRHDFTSSYQEHLRNAATYRSKIYGGKKN